VSLYASAQAFLLYKTMSIDMLSDVVSPPLVGELGVELTGENILNSLLSPHESFFSIKPLSQSFYSSFYIESPLITVTSNHIRGGVTIRYPKLVVWDNDGRKNAFKGIEIDITDLAEDNRNLTLCSNAGDFDFNSEARLFTNRVCLDFSFDAIENLYLTDASFEKGRVVTLRENPTKTLIIEQALYRDGESIKQQTGVGDFSALGLLFFATKLEQEAIGL
jgi:hypothetical protein